MSRVLCSIVYYINDESETKFYEFNKREKERKREKRGRGEE